MVRYHHRNEYFKYQPKSSYKNWVNNLWDKLTDVKTSGIFASLRNSENKIIENVLIITTIVVFIGFIVVSIYKLLNDDKKPLDKVRNTVKRSSNCIFDILNAFWTIKEIHVTNLQLEDDNEKFLKLVQDNLKGIKDNTDSINTDNCIDDYNPRDSNQNLNNILPSSVLAASSLNKNTSFTNSIMKNSSNLANNIKSGSSKVSVSKKNMNDARSDDKHKMLEKKIKNNNSSLGTSSLVNSQGEDDSLYQNITFQLDNIYTKNSEKIKPVKLFESQDFEFNFPNPEANASNNNINGSANNILMNKKVSDKENRNVTFESNNNYNDDPIIMRPMKKNQPTTTVTPPPSTSPPPTSGPSSTGTKIGLSGRSKDEVFRTNKAFDKRLLLNKGDLAAKKSFNSVNEYKGIFGPRKTN